MGWCVPARGGCVRAELVDDERAAEWAAKWRWMWAPMFSTRQEAKSLPPIGGVQKERSVLARRLGRDGERAERGQEDARMLHADSDAFGDSSKEWTTLTPELSHFAWSD